MENYKPIDWDNLPIKKELDSLPWDERLDTMVIIINFKLDAELNRSVKEHSKRLDKRFAHRYFDLLSPEEKSSMISYGFNTLNHLKAW